MTLETVASHHSAVRSAVFHLQRDGVLGDNLAVDHQLPAASLAKIYQAAAVFKLAEEGEVDLQAKSKLTLAEFRQGNYGTGRLRRTQIPLYTLLRAIQAKPHTPIMVRPISLKEKLTLMIRNSDNIAAFSVVEQVGREKIQQVLSFWDMADTSIYDPAKGRENLTTAANLGYFLYYLEAGLRLNRDHTEELISWLPQEKSLNAELVPLLLKSKEGKLQTGQNSFLHKAGYINQEGHQPGQRSDVFVILTQAPITQDGKTPYSQALHRRKLLKDITYFIP